MTYVKSWFSGNTESFSTGPCFGAGVAIWQDLTPMGDHGCSENLLMLSLSFCSPPCLDFIYFRDSSVIHSQPAPLCRLLYFQLGPVFVCFRVLDRRCAMSYYMCSRECLHTVREDQVCLGVISGILNGICLQFCLCFLHLLRCLI